MAASGIAGVFPAQNALRAGRLLFAQPGMTLFDPLVSIVWGVAVFHETVPGGSRLALAAFSGGLMVTGALFLVRSPPWSVKTWNRRSAHLSTRVLPTDEVDDRLWPAARFVCAQIEPRAVQPRIGPGLANWCPDSTAPDSPPGSSGAYKTPD